ncbi:YfbM family protein [Actinoplanes regularis]|uniref:YfbM family protein n=1 Tax=Actinoplanes regularis TaxID=52697 RepID=UPI0024A28226|nr:YfbM family protein [Actinoplanes regularis]GLW30505.1 hypothetical protein Areg01_34450 [Actinoplanes regularis]
MGMTMTGRRLAAGEVDALLADPGQVESFLFEAEPDLDLDKAWDGLHFVLAQAGGGAERALLGSDGWISAGGGAIQARLVPVEEARVVADALDAVDVSRLRAEFDPADLVEAGTYPHVWGEGTEEFDGYLLPALRELRVFYRKAADSGRAVLLGISI